MRLVLALFALAVSILPAHAQRSFEVQQPQGQWQQPGPFQQPRDVWLEPRPFQQLTAPWQVPGPFQTVPGDAPTRPFTQTIMEGWERGLRVVGNTRLEFEKSVSQPDTSRSRDQ